jgi:hypothetical protein
MKSAAAFLLVFGLAGCLGYRIGPVKPHYLSDVHTISVPTFKNSTLLPRIEVLVTDTVIKQLQQDGTYKVGRDKDADATLDAEIIKVSRSPARSARGNVLATTEFNLTMRVKYKLVGRDGKQLGAQGEAVGTTSFFVASTGGGEDVVADERQALPLAAEELATRLTSQLSEGW